MTVAQLSQGFNGHYGICEVGLNEALDSRKYISHRKSQSQSESESLQRFHTCRFLTVAALEVSPNGYEII